MACQALGRCRICARKHKIAVFGGEESQHFFIEKANLKLIILNTVCIVCIAKIERLVKKMDLDTIFSDCMKEEDDRATKPAVNTWSKKLSEKSDEKIETKDSKLESNIPSESMVMDVEDPVQRQRRFREIIHTSKETLSGSNHSGDVTENDTQTRPQSSGDSHASINPPHHFSEGTTGQNSLVAIEPRRKRPRSVPKIRLANEQPQQSSQTTDSSLNSSSFQPSGSAIAFADCGPSECSSRARKAGRFLCCDFCKKEFTHAGDLNKHRRKHTGEKPYECNQCQRKFAHASNLARHQRVHSGERPFVCPKCARTFTRRDKLAIHITAARCQPDTNDDNQLNQPSQEMSS